MLASMYFKWAARKGHEVETIQEPGMSPILLIRGPRVGAILEGEEGLHKLQREDSGQKKDRGRPATQVQLARIEVLCSVGTGHSPTPEIGDIHTREVAKDQKEHHSPLLEANHGTSGLSVRVQSSEEVARELLMALMARKESGLPPSEELVRVYHLSRAQYARDPRTGERSSRARDVLDGALDAFLLAYLKRQVDDSSPEEKDEEEE
jgi:protein subunit release factor B